MYVCNVCMYVCMYVCMHACMHVCMYVWKGLLTVQIKIFRAVFTQRRRQPLDIKVHAQDTSVWK